MAPTPSSEREIQQHRQLAREHRVASESLRAAEAQACSGIPEDDRDVSPLERVEDIASVRSWIEPPTPQPRTMQQVVGVFVTLRAVQGMTAEWLQRVVDCHIARNRAAGFEMPEMSDCPLAVSGVTARVVSSGNGFTVAIRANDPSSLRELEARAARLAARQGRR